MKQIPLSQGLFATVDDEDFEWLTKYKWYAAPRSGKFYASTTKNNRDVYMHRLILGLIDPKIHVDHRDGSGLNNCRSNLRTCTQPENMLNRMPHKNNTSGFKGVCFCKESGKWITSISIYGMYKKIGRFKTKEEAARAYDEAAKKYHGEFARLNFPEAGYSPQTD